MARLQHKHLVHRATITPLATETAEGDTRGTPVKVPAYVEFKARLVIDRRVDSPTFLQQIVSRSMVIVLPDVVAPPRTLVKVWEGTPYERESQVVDCAVLDYRGTPNHVELYLE